MKIQLAYWLKVTAVDQSASLERLEAGGHDKLRDLLLRGFVFTGEEDPHRSGPASRATHPVVLSASTTGSINSIATFAATSTPGAQKL